MDVVANYAASKEAVGAFFNHENDKGKAPTDDDKGPSKGPKKNKKKKRTRKIKREALDDDFVAAVERKKPQGPPEGAVFDKMLKEPCPLLGLLNIITKSRLSFLILITVPKMSNLSLIPLKPSCHPQHDMRDAVLKYAIAHLNK